MSRKVSSEVKTVVVYRQDRKVMKHLRATVGKEPWMQFEVAEWASRGSGPFERWLPRAWSVPSSLLRTLVPIGKSEADALLTLKSKAGIRGAQKRKQRRKQALDQAAKEIGALPGSKLAEAYLEGAVDGDEAELRAFKAHYRHQHTNYEHLLDEYRLAPSDWARLDREERWMEARLVREQARVERQEDRPKFFWLVRVPRLL